MSGLAAEYIGIAESSFLAAFLVFVRVGAMMASLPAFGERSVPVRIRLALTAAFTAIVFPFAAQSIDPIADEPSAVALAFGTEIIAGLILGLSIRLFVLALQTAGAIAAQATSLAQIFGNIVVDPQPALANLLVLAGLALAVVLGLHVKVVEFLVLSYQIFPPGRLPLGTDLAAWGTAHISTMFSLAFVLAAPFVAVSLLYNLALGAINRAMPQLMVAFVGAPAITLAALILLAVSSPFLLSVWIKAMDGFFANPFGQI